MYKFVYKITKNHMASVISACIYITAPYHLTDLYNRIAIAELTSFVFLPITFLGMYNLFDDNKKTYYIAIGAIGLILTHNVITVYTAIFCVIYTLINFKKLKDIKIIKKILINIVIILLCTSFYWMPLLEHYASTTYEVFVPNRMYNDATLIDSKLSLTDLIITIPWGLNFHLGIPIILGSILTCIYISKIDEKYRKTILAFFVFGIISIIMCLKIFPFEHLPDLFKMLQFVWRMMEFVSFFLSVVAGIAIAKFIEKNDARKMLVFVVMVVYTTALIINTRQYTEVAFDEKEFLTPVTVQNMSGRVHAGCATFEYLPQKAYKNLDYIKTRSESAIVLEGNASISNENKNGLNMEFEVQAENGTAIIEVPYIYYLGYTAKINNNENNVSNLEIKESNKGFCMIEIATSGTVSVEYSGTILMKQSYILTYIGIILFIIIQIRKSNF